MDKHIHAESVFQDSSQSIVTENSIYDFNRLSSHEIDVIITVLRNAYSDKYHKSLRGIGLMNEAYPITYKPRYILLETVVLLFENSHNPYDALAVAEAYRNKGAAYRVSAIENYERYLAKANIFKKKLVREQFVIFNDIFLYNNLSTLYEAEHNLWRALKYAEMAEALNADLLPYYPIHIAKILLKIDPNKAVSYLTDIMNGPRYSGSKAIIQKTVTELEQKAASGYRYRPRSKKSIPDSIDADIRKATLEFLPGGKYYPLWEK